MAFDYEAETDDEAVRRVAGEMTGAPLAQLCAEEIVAREAQQEQYRQQEEQWRHEHEQQAAAKAEQERAEWLKEHRQQEAIRQRERQQQINQELHRRDMMDLRLAAARADTFQRNVETAHRNALAYQQRQTLLNNLEAMINPPEPPPERIVVVEADPDDSEFCGVEKIYRPNPRRSWW
jgi:hypothetical protein